MTFTELLDGAEILSRSGDAEVLSIEYDSRRVKAGTCFVAMRGEKTDGNRYIAAAIAAGAVAIVSDSLDAAPEGVAFARVEHGRRALGRMSANFFHRPAEKLAVTGVTGTNGKTTTTFLMAAMLEAARKKSALIGTIEYRMAGKTMEAPHTTPESLELNRFFAEAVQAGASDAVMEVSSHALAQERVWGVPFDVAVFTNLTRDHLDYHKDMDDYFAAKRVLFEGCGTAPPRVAVINQDDEYGRKLISCCRSRSEVIAYGFSEGDFHARDVELSASGTRFEMQTPAGAISLFSPLAGRVNVFNILAASAAAYARGCSLGHIAEAVRGLDHVPGRFQTVDRGQPFTVVVDYAHTDDALRNLTAIAREFVKHGGKKGKVITMFGCGGDRDKAKRPLMAKAAGNGSDLVVLTSDNPRSEDPMAIIQDALPGLRATKAEFLVEPDRRRAIAAALRAARPGDIVLIAGKGHEKFQIFDDEREPFDDCVEAEKALSNLGFCSEFEQALTKGLEGLRV